MLRLFKRHIGLFTVTSLVLQCGQYLHAQAPIVEEPNYTPTLTFDVATIRPAPPLIITKEELDLGIAALDGNLYLADALVEAE